MLIRNGQKRETKDEKLKKFSTLESLTKLLKLRK